MAFASRGVSIWVACHWIACQKGSRSAAQDLRRSRLHRGGCVSRLRQRQRDLPDASTPGRAGIPTRTCWTQHRAQFKPEAVWDIEAGAKLTGEDVGARADCSRDSCSIASARFRTQYRFLICAVNQVPPFDATEHWPQSIDGVADGELRRVDEDRRTGFRRRAALRSQCRQDSPTTVSGRHPDRRAYRQDFNVLQLAHAFEQATGFGKRRPEDA